MADGIKVPLTVTIAAGDVVIAEAVDSRLASFVLDVLLRPADYSLEPLSPRFLPPGYRSFP